MLLQQSIQPPPSSGHRAPTAAGAAPPDAVEVRVLDGHCQAVLVSITGAVTVPALRVLEHRLAPAIRRAKGRVPKVLLDMNAVTSVDRDALDVLFDLQRRIIELGCRFALVDPSASVVCLLHDVAGY
jgi:anti-anti-sigma regulatory factor